ncbi:MAG TPA: metallophosphoesterase [Actinomycetota bacterium]|nr:metallophosphoesterase [Actinomycetota bacterium]
MPHLLRWALAAGAAAFVYGLYEPFRFRLVSKDVPVDWGGPPLDILHLSDMHLSPGNARLTEFLRSLPDMLERTPDLVLATGDLIRGDDAIDPVVDLLASIEARLGRFYVLGSHDYYVSAGPSYWKYFSKERRVRSKTRTDVTRLEDGLRAKGWVPLTNRTETVEHDGGTIRLSGVDDPYLNRHDTSHIRRTAGDDLAIGLVHAPNVVTEWALAGFDLVVAGHTHAGQVRIPLVGAVVTNSDLPAALASGLHRIGRTWLHVSPGLGTGKYAPIRFLARPEATVLRLRGA